MAAVLRVVMVDAEVLVDGAAWYDNTHDDDNSDDDNSDARDDRHVHDEVAVDEVRQAVRADEGVPADVVVAVRMHTCLLADKKMRICIVS